MKIISPIILSILFITVHTSLPCVLCQGIVKVVDFMFLHVIPQKAAAEMVQILCMRKFDSKPLCQKVGKEIAPIGIKSVLKNYLNPDHICSQLCGNNYKRYIADQQVSRILGIEKADPVVLDLQNFIERATFELSMPSRNLNILHLSDIHLDPHYTQNSSIYCSYPICCHPQHGYPQNPAARAPKLGSKNCDSPIILFQQLLNSLENYPKQIDIVIATGDFSAHNQWQKTNEQIHDNNKRVEQKIKGQNKLKDAVYIRSQGNNDYTPDHQYDPTNTKLLSVYKLRDPKSSRNMTFISINTIIYDNYNLYLLGDQTYAIFQLMLLEQEFINSQNIYLIGHIPPHLSQTAPEYSKVFRSLIAKYSSKIINQFYGHTHLDQLSINTFPGNPKQITGFSFITPSVSPLYVGKSKYRIYEVQVSQKVSGVIDYTQYIINSLNDTKAQWLIDYSFRSKYTTQSTQPITKEQIREITDQILSHHGFKRQKYLRGIGSLKQSQLRLTKQACFILDDPKQKEKCLHRSGAYFNSNLFDVIDVLRGQWGFDKKQAINE